MSNERPVPPIGLQPQKGSNLSLRKNNKGAEYFRLEGISPRTGPTLSTGSSDYSAPIAPAIAPSVDLCTTLYQQLDDVKRWAWISDDSEGYNVVEILTESGSTVTVKTLSGESKTIERGQNELFEFKRDAIRHAVDDLVRLEDMNIPTIMMNVRERAEKDLIYTNIGSILVSVNPYQLMPIYTPAVMEQYRRQLPNLPPHPFNLADQCYRAIFDEKRSQSILVSGESGAGKTEAVKVVLQYLTEVAGSSSGVEQKILLANPILEAFGNAKTIRNNNSSRFGKWVEIHLSGGRIIGGKITNYLLEKTRVVQQSSAERNYHIFYQLVGYANVPGVHNNELKTSLGLGQASDYTILRQGDCTSIEGVDDVEDFKQTLKAMRQLQFDELQIGVVMKLLAAILHLGNIIFERDGDDKCHIAASSKSALAKAAQLLALDVALLEKALTTRSMMMAKETTTIPLNEFKARESRDSLAKYLYGALFDWLVAQINVALASHRDTKVEVHFIGVLDIFGFELLQNNSFEQLCINFTNEKLQQMFNSSIFKEEEAIYRTEGINHESVTFVDNQDIIDMIERKKVGLFAMMDEELRIPKSTDKTYLDKIATSYKEHAHFAIPIKTPNTFTIHHYAGAVTYNVDGFLDKNKDRMFDDLVRVIHDTKIPLIRSIVATQDGNDGDVTSKVTSASLGSKFLVQLKELSTNIASTTAHYIRCIKPNNEFKPSSQKFDTPMALRQLRYAGVFEAVAIRKKGFPYRLSYHDFVKRFYMLSQKPLGAIHGITLEEARAKVEDITSGLGNDLRTRLQYGKSLVFYKADELKCLEDQRSTALKAKVIMVQKLLRGFRARRQYEKLAAIRDALIAALESRQMEDLENALAMSMEVDWELREAIQARAMLVRVKEEHKLLTRFDMLFPTPETLGELSEGQETKAKELAELADDMVPPMEHEKIELLKKILVKSAQLREQRLKAEAEQRQREEEARLAAQSEAERRAEAERIAQARAAETERKALEESKKRMEEQFHMNKWEDDESNSDAANALNVLFTSKQSHGETRSRRGTVIEMDEETKALARAALPAAIVEEEEEAKPFINFTPEELAKIERVKNRLLEAMSAPPYSIMDGVMFQADGTVNVSMSASTALKQAIIAAKQIGAFEHQDKDLRRAAYTAQMLMGIRLDCSTADWGTVRARLDGAKAAASGFLEVPEISAARVLVGKMDVMENLELAATARDEPLMRTWLEQAKNYNLDVDEFVKIHKALVDLLQFVEISLNARDYVKIQSCIQAIEQLGNPSYLVKYKTSCIEAVENRKPMLLQLIRKSIQELPSRAEMQSLKNQAEVLGFKSEDTDKLDELLKLSDEKLCRAQLEIARANGDETRILNLNIELKAHLLERFSKKLGYADAPPLKTAAEFASGKVFGKEKVMEGLHTWTSTPIHAALTRNLDRKVEDQAVKLFRNVMGWMGDRHYSYPITLLHEITTKVVNVPSLRDEIFAQVIKQLTSNPSADSMKRGWQMLLVLLMIAPPSPKFENYVGVWLLEHGQSYHIHELHETVLKGGLATPPTLPEIIYIIYHLPPTPGESYASAKSITLEQAQKSGVDLSTPLETPALDRFDRHTTMRGHNETIKRERKRISDMRPPKRK